MIKVFILLKKKATKKCIGVQQASVYFYSHMIREIQSRDQSDYAISNRTNRSIVDFLEINWT